MKLWKLTPALVLVFVFVGGSVAGIPEDEAIRVVQEAMARAVTIPEQATALARLAWPEEGSEVDPAVSAAARRELVGFGSLGMRAIRGALQRCGRERSADITAALIDAMKQETAGIPADYLPGLDQALWFGSPDAQRLAMAEAARFGEGRAVLPIIDAAIESPELVPDAIEALATLRNDRARFWLADLTRDGSDEQSSAAAAALARIGGAAISTLEELCLSQDDRARRRAVLALSQVAGPAEVTTLHEYLFRFPEDDPQVRDLVREAAIRIERWIDAFHAGQGVDPEPDR